MKRYLKMLTIVVIYFHVRWAVRHFHSLGEGCTEKWKQYNIVIGVKYYLDDN